MHSIVDLITNSSTVLYTDSSKSVDALKDVMREIFKLHNIDKKIKDVFDISLIVDDLDEYMYEYISDNYDEFGLEYDDERLHESVDTLVTKYIEDMNSGKMDTPEWVSDLVNDSRTNWISIKVKDSKYEHLAELLHTLIYSVDVDEEYD